MAAVVAGFLFDRMELLRSYLFAYVFWTGLGMGCLGILLLHHTVGGKWGMMIRRLCEAGACTLPYMGILLIPILVNIPALYVWATPEGAQDPVVVKKAAYLNIPFFVARSFFYFSIFTLYARRLTGMSVRLDATGDQRLIGQMRKWSAPGLVVFVFTASFAFVDWVMSLEPDWFSTIYGAMFLIGQVLGAFALTIAIVVMLREQHPFEGRITPQHFHDLGNMMFAFTVLWAYLSFSQFLIIWAGNLPEEIPWYIRRLSEGWGGVAAFLIVFHFCVPFVLLLQRDVKRRTGLLLKMCLFMLVVRMVDVYWLVAPAFYSDHIQVHWTDLAAMAGLGGLWLALFFREMGLRTLLPVEDRRVEGAPKEMVAY